MKRLFGTAIAALLSTSAYAADVNNAYNAMATLPIKASAFIGTPCSLGTAASATSAATPLTCSGFYVGGGLAGEGSNADIIGSGIAGSVFAGGITPTGIGGIQYINGNWILGAELDIGYSVATKAVVNGVGNGFNGFRITEDFKAGGNLNGILGVQPIVTVPASLQQSVLGLYAHIGVTQWQLPGAWANGVESGAGFLYDISPHLFGDVRYTYTNFSGARANAIRINDDNSVMAAILYKF